ncbi:MAG: HAMP domain-containing protein [Anaerolineaceae bacterium]|nr:HAMP domain-containing protein [Anaerolineaceae bacterium]
MRLRLFLAFAIIVLVTLMGLSISIRLATENEVKEFWAKGGPLGAQNLVTNLENFYAEFHTWEGVETLLEPIHQGSSGQGQGNRGQGNRQGTVWNYRIADQDGVLVFNGIDGDLSTQLSRDDLNNGIEIIVEEKVVGYVLPEEGVGIPGEEFEEDLIAQVNKASLQMAVISGILSLVLAIVFAYLLLKPISRLEKAAINMADGDLSQRVEVKGKDELAALGIAFNHMASSLEKAELNRQSMTADIAHELRTPLSIQRANLEAMIDGVYPLDKENLERLVSQNQLLVRLVEDLRTLALADSGELQFHKRLTDLNRLVKIVADRFFAQAEEKDIQLAFYQVEKCEEMMVDPDRIEQILTNLLQNAIRYGKEKGKIDVSMVCNNDQIEIKVHDNGPGIPDELLTEVFERFFRKDKARSREDGGTGLGLAIARQLARAHGGDLLAANHPAGGAEFTLIL